MTPADQPTPGSPRTLADILREAGIEPVGVGGRRHRIETSAEPDPDLDPAGDTDAEPEPEPDAGDRREVSWHRGVLSWLVFAVELVVAAVLGVLIWYTFNLLWELYPYAAAAAAPLVLAGVVATGQMLRRWRSQEPLGTAAITALLLVAAILVVLPAAVVLARS